MTCDLINDRGAKAQKQVGNEHSVDNMVEDDVTERLENGRTECDVDGEGKAVPDGEQHDQQVPPNLEGIVHADHVKRQFHVHLELLLCA